VKIWALSLLIVLSITISCGKAPDNSFNISNVNLDIKDIEIIKTKTFEGLLLGGDFDRNEIFIQLTLYPDSNHSIGIIDIETENQKKTFSLRKGGVQSPTDLNNPTYMQFLDNRYYLVDWFDKILVFDYELTYLYTNMFHISRYFIDFYKKNGELFFVIGNRSAGPEMNTCSIEIFKMIERKKQEFKRRIGENYHKSLYYKWESDEKRLHKGVLWSSDWGFEKEGKIYFAHGGERQYFVYDLNNESLAAINLDYLQGKKYSDNEARIVGYYKSNGWEEKFYKDFKQKVLYRALPDKIYYFGFYDVGENKIGIAGDLDLERMKFRLDVFNANSREYLGSIWLPIGHGFFRHLHSDDRDFFRERINVDRGIYIWLDLEGEDLEFTTKLTRFRIKNWE
jgi:hypothetical protein